MFTGLIQKLGKIKNRIGDTIEVSAELPSSLKLGDSISVNGICLTAIQISNQSFSANLSKETLSKTSSDEWVEDDPVNLEFPLMASAPLGGHIVQGHIDGVGRILSIEEIEGSRRIQIQFPSELAACIVSKGSIAVDGVSLTVNEVSNSTFSVMIIPHTWTQTIFHTYRMGQKVNLEVDILAKYVQRAFESFKGSVSL
jgi:riboflavin synthase